MSFREVKDLRKAGKLDEALKMAQENLQANPNDIWNKRSISWVYYEYLKKYSKAEDYNDFKENLLSIRDLEFPEEEKLLFDSCAWQIGKMLFSLTRNKNNPEEHKVREIFQICRTFHFTKPSEAYSFLFKAFHKAFNNLQDPRLYVEFAEWWGLENFRNEDYLEEEYNGRKIMSTAEKAYTAYPKKILLLNPLDKERIEDCLVKLDALMEKYPDYKYTAFYKAKLLIAIGDDDNVLSAFLPFAKQKQNDFWVWELLAEIFKDDPEKQMACYCKALSLKTPEDFLVKLRFNFAEFLLEQKLFDEAKTELKIVEDIRNKKGWKIPNDILLYQHAEWYANAKENKNNKSLYKKHAPQAVEILYADLPEETVAVEFVNHNKKILNFVKNKQMNGFFKYANFVKQPKIGDFLKVRLNPIGNEGFYKVLTLKETEEVPTEAIKDFEGRLNIPNGKSFGFVKDLFIEPKVIEMNELLNGDNLKAQGILSFDKSKQKWGWKAVQIRKI